MIKVKAIVQCKDCDYKEKMYLNVFNGMVESPKDWINGLCPKCNKENITEKAQK